MALTPGTRLGPYDITTPIGAGGMGEVYRARDTKLDRDVAIKVLPDFLARDPERLARFEREAKVLASLNHPHIATIYGLEESAAGKAIAMELVDGATLKTPLPLAEALRIALEIAEALEAAHEKGITHRDLKPANVMLTASRSVKVLDFGLAAVSRPTAPADHDSPTLSMGMTEAGMIMGTAAYMAPGQAAGQAVDRRADIWAFGVVLWELVTGARLFEGDSTAHILADVIRADIDFGKLPTQTPPAVRQLLRRCLDRDVKSRLQWIGEARIALSTAITHPERTEVPSGPVARPSAIQTWLPWAVATTLAAGGAGLAYVVYRHVTEPASQIVRSLILLPEKTLLAVNSPPAVSPDGRKLAFVATGDGKTLVWIRDLDSVTARSLTGTDDAATPFWSPDSRSVGFIAQGRLKRIDIAGGAAVTLAAVDGRVHGATWSPRGVILFPLSATTSLYRVADTGGTPVPVTMLDTEAGEQSHRLPWFMPDGHHFLFTVRNQDQVAKSGLYAADMDAPGRTLVLKGEVHAAYLPASRLLLFTVGGDLDSPLMAQAMDASTFRLSGDPVRVAESVDLSVGIWAQHQFSTSSNGVLAHASNGASDASQLAWFDRTGKSLGTVPIQGTVLDSPVISPDGRTIAIGVMRSGARDIWLYDVPRGTASRLTFGDPAHGVGSGFAVWSSDGKSLVYLSLTSSLGSAIMRRPVAADGTAENLGAPWGVSARSARNIVLSPDGRYAAAVLTGEQTAGQSTASDIWMLPLTAGGEKPRPYLQSRAYEDRPAFSPSGNWIAYSSDETRRSEIFVQSFPVPGRKYQVSVDGGGMPVWSRDGKELYFIARNRQMMAVAVSDSGGTLEIGAPRALFDSGLIDVQTRGFDVSADGRFLIPVQAPGSTMPLTLVTNWPLAMNPR